MHERTRKQWEALSPERRAKAEAALARLHGPESRAEEAEIRERFRSRPGPDELLAMGEIDREARDRMVEELAAVPPRDPIPAVRALKGERERLGLSLAEVAERSGIDQPALSRLESGSNANPTVATLERYAQALGKRFLWAFEPAATARD